MHFLKQRKINVDKTLTHIEVGHMYAAIEPMNWVDTVKRNPMFVVLESQCRADGYAMCNVLIGEHVCHLIFKIENVKKVI